MKLELEPNEIQYLVSLASQVPMGQTLQVGMTHLIPKILEQTNGPQGGNVDVSSAGQSGGVTAGNVGTGTPAA